MKMAGGALTPCIRTDLWGDAPPQNQTACGKVNSHMQGLCLGQRHAQCRERFDESVFQYADCCGGWCMDWREHFNDRLMKETDPR